MTDFIKINDYANIYFGEDILSPKLYLSTGNFNIQKIIPLKDLDSLLNDNKEVTEYFTAKVIKGFLEIKFIDGFTCSFNPRDYSVIKREIQTYNLNQVF